MTAGRGLGNVCKIGGTKMIFSLPISFLATLKGVATKF